jgi:hypothetical protein
LTVQGSPPDTFINHSEMAAELQLNSGPKLRRQTKKKNAHSP